ncbi:hypothetical protein BU16DRAFT_586871 [Lophium mytilinum]|uniref:C2H2-type domain-containing protein n=1 Tax=Lophium mytilinum TaxID=390894 RepID=A0A6A6Q9G0_9PEZI|nr:hypothetical protein BU16DRAFT_586871 [Lophium mytilinum]
MPIKLDEHCTEKPAVQTETPVTYGQCRELDPDARSIPSAGVCLISSGNESSQVSGSSSTQVNSINKVSPARDAEINEAKELLDVATAKLRAGIVQELLDYASTCCVDSPESSGSNDTISSEQTTKSSDETSVTFWDNSAQTSMQKRSRDSHREEPGDDSDKSDDGDDDDRRRKKQKADIPGGEITGRRLKCPYHQREPGRYIRAACRGQGFADMAKLKDHLKRVHTQPLRCARCWEEMESDDAFTKHLQTDERCTKRVEPKDDRIKPQQLKLLDFKKAPYAQLKDTEKKWRMLYQVLFPQDKDIPPAFEHHGMTAGLEKLLAEALEEELTKELGPALHHIMSKIKDKIPMIIQKCKSRVFGGPSSQSVAYTPSSTSMTSPMPDMDANSDAERMSTSALPWESLQRSSSYQNSIVAGGELTQITYNGQMEPPPRPSDESFRGDGNTVFQISSNQLHCATSQSIPSFSERQNAPYTANHGLGALEYQTVPSAECTCKASERHTGGSVLPIETSNVQDRSSLASLPVIDEWEFPSDNTMSDFSQYLRDLGS